MSGLTVVIGASENPTRYSQMAIKSLLSHGEPVAAVGLKDGEFEGVKIHGDRPQFGNVETVTLYVGPKHQPAWFDYIISLKPKRVIFNPGTENSDFFDLCRENNIEVVIACTLVMLSIGNY